MHAETCKASLSLTPIASQLTQWHGGATLYRAKNGCWSWQMLNMPHWPQTMVKTKMCSRPVVKTKMRSSCQNVCETSPLTHLSVPLGGPGIWYDIYSIIIYIYILCVCLCKRGPNRNVNNHRCIMTRTVRDPSIYCHPPGARCPSQSSHHKASPAPSLMNWRTVFWMVPAAYPRGRKR